MALDAYSLTPTNANPPRNKTILITGGASGIGLATALYLHAHQNNIIILDKSTSPPQGIPSLTTSPRYLYIPCDILSWSSQRDAFAAGAQKFGSIDCVFINAGVSEIGDQIWKDDYDSLGQLAEPNRLTIDVDLRALGDTLKLAMYHLRNDTKAGSGRGKGGSIVMTASFAGYLASAGAPLYSAAKHGIVGHMRALKGDCAKVGIAISVIAPGITLTNLVLGVKEGQTLEEWGKEMSARGVPINSAETVALVVSNLFGLGMRGNGKGILVQANRCVDVEERIAKSRERWMGREMLDLFRGGRKAPLFPNKL